MNTEPVLSVSDFVAVFNQTVSYAYPSVTIVGELANFRVSKNRWLYFDLKDELATVKFFGNVHQLQTTLEEGMVLTVKGIPQLHPQFGFSITVQTIQLSGEGTIKRAAKLLEAKLKHEGLFDENRKRTIPFPAESIGLITSGESAAYADFIKILHERWGGVDVQLFDVQVQGEDAPSQITKALEYFNSHSHPPEVLVITRGGGSADDLQAFSSEQVVRSVASSRIPTLVAIGHEIDISLAELAADVRASTPSNAAQKLVPERGEVKNWLISIKDQTKQLIRSQLTDESRAVKEELNFAATQLDHRLSLEQQNLTNIKQVLALLHPQTILKRGYAIVRRKTEIISSIKSIEKNVELNVQLQDGSFIAVVKGEVQ